MLTEMQMMCKDLTGWSVDSVGEKVNEIIRALNAMEEANTTTNMPTTPCLFAHMHLAYKGNNYVYCQWCGVKL